MGDEHFTYYMTDAGETIVRDSLGYRLVEDDEEWQALLSEANGRREAVRRKVGSAANAPLGQHGVKRVPVVLVSFADKDFAVGEDAEAVNRYYHLYCNGNADGSPYTGHGSKGSLREYFTEQSRAEENSSLSSPPSVPSSSTRDTLTTAPTRPMESARTSTMTSSALKPSAKPRPQEQTGASMTTTAMALLTW